MALIILIWHNNRYTLKKEITPLYTIYLFIIYYDIKKKKNNYN